MFDAQDRLGILLQRLLTKCNHRISTEIRSTQYETFSYDGKFISSRWSDACSNMISLLTEGRRKSDQWRWFHAQSNVRSSTAGSTHWHRTRKKTSISLSERYHPTTDVFFSDSGWFELPILRRWSPFHPQRSISALFDQGWIQKLSRTSSFVAFRSLNSSFRSPVLFSREAPRHSISDGMCLSGTAHESFGSCRDGEETTTTQQHHSRVE